MAVTPTTWNPSDKDSTVTLSGGDLTATFSFGSVRSVASVPSGKYYWEVTFPSGVTTEHIGVATAASAMSMWLGGDAYGWGASVSDGVVTNGSIGVATLSTPPTTTLSVLLDADAKTLKYWVDGADAGVTITLTGAAFFAAAGYFGEATANFGATAFTYTPPAGYEAGFGAPDINRKVYPEGKSAFAAGAPTAIYGPNRTAQVVGAGLLSTGTANAIASEDVTVYPQGNAIFAAGTAAAIRGPNRTVQADGGAAFSSGVHKAQLGYPATVTPDGASAFSAGAPTALPYAAKILPVPGASVFSSGRPMAIADPIAVGSRTVRAVGSSIFGAGTPSTKGAATAQASGAKVFSAGTTTAYATANVVGVSVFRAGSPKAYATAHPIGASVFSTGLPRITNTVLAKGAGVFRAGTPKALGGASVSVVGASVFRTGAPIIGDTGTYVRGASVFRAGHPSIVRDSTC